MSDTPLTAKTVEELQIDFGEIKVARERLVQEKRGLEAQLADCNAQRAAFLPRDKYRKVMEGRASIIRMMTEKERDINVLNARATEVNTVLEVRKRQADQLSVGTVKQLVELRDRWHGFSMENTNHQKAREVAYKFSQELKELLKPHFAKA